MRRHLFALLLLPLAGCTVFRASVEVPEVCATFHEVEIAGMGPGQTFRDATLVDVTEIFSGFFQVGGTIRSASATLRAHEDVPDLTFLETVRVSMRGAVPGGERPPITLVRCVDFACASETNTSSLEADVSEDIMDYVGAGEVQLDIVMTGPLPLHAWRVDIEVCLSGDATLALEL